MSPEPLHPPLPPIQTAAEYEAAVARFWALVNRPNDLALLLAMREVMRAYEYAHGPDKPAASGE
ncbi:hypothetical protein [Hymenobacter mucosus]|uniref:Uncharacterized protein n=1 Tax=Hymenobacter mucosus TaxID=1411120 RepID=A0A239BGL8_9BACT|nr:hypothetical protein [Hymenobacter mucosus]SNS06591.1 hypothetical protein SAMN06269173_1237 [Hymenobacter mucosus]